MPTEREGQLELTDALVEEVRVARRRRSVTKEKLARRLASRVYGQEAALERVAAVVSAQLAKRAPAAPGPVMLAHLVDLGRPATRARAGVRLTHRAPVREPPHPDGRSHPRQRAPWGRPATPEDDGRRRGDTEKGPANWPAPSCSTRRDVG